MTVQSGPWSFSADFGVSRAGQIRESWNSFALLLVGLFDVSFRVGNFLSQSTQKLSLLESAKEDSCFTTSTLGEMDLPV